MKTIGLIGGMSWQSTVPYYQIINRTVAQQLGGLHSAKVLLHSVDFAEIEPLQKSGDWDALAGVLANAAKGLVASGAGLVVICTNTMHIVAPKVAAAVPAPLLYIAAATADELAAKGVHRVGLLGTKYTMQQDFFKSVLWERGMEVLLPNAWQMDEVHRVIFEELCRGEVTRDARRFYLAVIDELARQGAQGVILGCTEIGLLVGQADTAVPLFDTTDIHARRAALWALEED